MRSSLAEIRPLRTSSTVSYTRACCQDTHFQRMSQRFMSSTRNAQLTVVQLLGSRRRRAYPSRFLNTRRARRCGLPVSFGRLVPSTPRCRVTGTEPGSLDNSTTSARSAATPRQPHSRTVNGTKGKTAKHAAVQVRLVQPDTGFGRPGLRIR